MPPLILHLLAACCGSGEPVWLPMDPVYLGGGSVTIQLADFLDDDRGSPTFAASDDPDVLTELDGSALTLTPQPDWEGSTVITVTATDGCDQRVATSIEVRSEAPPGTTDPGGCPWSFAWDPVGAPDAVAVAGDWNDWSTEADLLAFDGERWVLERTLPPGPHTYKIVELEEQAFEDVEAWSCDPAAPWLQCDAGTWTPWDTTTPRTCTSGNPCNSMIVVPSCGIPRLEVDHVDLDRGAGAIEVAALVVPGSGGAATAAEATLDGEGVPATLDGDHVRVEVSGLSVGRHTLRLAVTDAGGATSAETQVPFWTDDFDWDRGVVYFAFVDRLLDGDPSNDDPQGATAEGGDYEGGDFAGVRQLLPYLEDLGVNVLWISNPQDNADGAFAGSCDLTYAGYHAYWPADPTATEPTFGTADELRALVDDAHSRGMRVLMDWVGNHVHEDHPYAVDHPEWFHAYANCNDTVDGSMNFDRIPEECWFASYLPDVDHANPEALAAMIDDAMWWAETYELDGFRVDAVKHMSHATAWNLEAEVERRLEHRAAGSDHEFWTVGETFDGYDKIAAYVGENQLDGQFDFPLYYTIRSVFAYGQGTVGDLMASADTSAATYGDARMSTFLGNHDVNRFVTDASGGGGVCDGQAIAVAPEPGDPWAYQSLRLGFTFLFTSPDLPLVYYGDELGVPGNGDPDNRHPLAWHVSDLAGVRSVDDLASRVGPEQAATARHVSRLAKARADHAALSAEDWIEWWREPDLYAYARSSGADHALVVLNRGAGERVLDNGLSFAGLPQGTYEDVLSGASVSSNGDRLVLRVPGRTSVVLVHR